MVGIGLSKGIVLKVFLVLFIPMNLQRKHILLPLKIKRPKSSFPRYFWFMLQSLRVKKPRIDLQIIKFFKYCLNLFQPQNMKHRK